MEEIGRRLQATRVAKGLTLQEVEDETRIRKKYIEALESGRTVLIPGEVYVKGFLRTYGNFLGLDGEGLVEEYKASQRPTQSPGDLPVNEEAPAPAAVEVKPEPDEEKPAARWEPPEATPRSPAFAAPPRAAGRRGGDRQGRRSQGGRGRASSQGTYLFRRALVTLVVLAPLVGLGYWLYDRMAAAPAPEPTPPPVSEKQPDQTKPDPPPPPPPEPPKPTVTMTGPKGTDVSFAVSTSPVKVRMEGFRDGFPWMEWTVDEKIVFSGKPNGPLEHEGQKIIINVGYMTGVDLVINDQRFTEPLKGGNYWITVKGPE